MTYIHDANLARRNGRVLALSFLLVAGMVGLSFAAVPLYDLFCRVTGFGGTTQVAQTGTVPGGGVVLDRQVDIRFVTDAAQGLPWSFQADTGTTTLNVGEASLAHFSVTNDSDQPLAGTAVYNVAPGRAGLYFVKMQCFCFDEQIIGPGETKTFPVYYYIDPAIADDPQLDGLGQISLSYTFYASESDNLDRAIQDFQQRMQDAVAETAAR